MKQQKNNGTNKSIKRGAGRLLSLCCFLSAAFFSSLSVARADSFAKAAQSAAEGIQGSAAGATKWIIMGVMVVIGLIFLVGTQQQKEHTKGEIFIKLIGAVLIVGAASYANIIFGWLG